MSVRAFQPRSIDPPHFVAENGDDLADMVGGFVGAEQCDGCGNSEYRIERDGRHYVARCAVEDPEYEFAHPAPCGAAYHIGIYDDEEVTW